MSWVKLDDGFYDHRKVVAAGAHGLALWVVGLAYCNRQPQRDGFIPDGKVECLFPIPKAKRVAARLVEVGLWVRVEGGYQVHDYHDFQPDAGRAAEISAKRAEAGRRGGARSGETRREANPKQIASRVLRVVKQADEANANPVPVPVPETLSDESVSRARDEAASLPPELRGQSLLAAPIPDLAERDPASGLVLLPRLKSHAEACGCANPEAAWRHWHAERWKRRGERRTWCTDWLADFEAWLLNHGRYGCPCQAKADTKPKPAGAAPVRDFTGVTAAQREVEMLAEDAAFQAEMARRDAARATTTPTSAAPQAAGGAA